MAWCRCAAVTSVEYFYTAEMLDRRGLAAIKNDVHKKQKALEFLIPAPF